MGSIRVFYSYAHEDRHHLDGVMQSLQELKTKAIIDGWSDGMLRVSERWDDTIKRALNRSHLIVFLITPSLLKSEYVNTQEMRIALQREAQGQCQILPILLERPTSMGLWYDSPLAKFQPAPAIDKWVNESGGFTSANEHMISLGVLDACKAVGGGDNPLRRSRVGDWRRVRGYARYPTGQIAEWEFTEELLEKTEDKAIVRQRNSYTTAINENVLEYSLLEPLKEQFGSIATQSGQDWSAMEAMSIRKSAAGPELREELITINMQHYETRVRSETLHGKMQEISVTSIDTIWQSLEAPFDGIVQAEQELSFKNGPNNFASQRLLEHGNASDGKPVPEPRMLRPMPPQYSAPTSVDGSRPQHAPQLNEAPPTAKGFFGAFVAGFKESFGQQTAEVVTPGQWWLEANDGFGHASFQLNLQNGGFFDGTSIQNGVYYQLNGGWNYSAANRVLMLSGSGAAMGNPAMPLQLSFQIDASNGSLCYASDPPGRCLQIRRVE